MLVNQQPVLLFDPFDTRLRFGKSIQFHGIFGGSDQCKGVREPMRHSEGLWEASRGTQNSNILFVRLQCSQDLIAGLISDAISNLRQSTQVRVEKSRQVGKTDRPRHIRANLLPRTRELLSQMMQGTINVTEQSRSFMEEKFSSRSDA